MVLDQTLENDTPDTQPHIIKLKKKKKGRKETGEDRLPDVLQFTVLSPPQNILNKKARGDMTSAYRITLPRGAGVVVKIDGRQSFSQLLVYDL